MAVHSADMLDAGRAALAAQPFSAWLGTELQAFGSSGAVLRLAVRPEMLQQHGFVHGGVVSYLADNALTFAGGAALGPAVVTSEYKINYLRPALGEALLAKAHVVQAGRNQAVVRCEIYSVSADSERLCATAQGTIARLGSDASE